MVWLLTSAIIRGNNVRFGSFQKIRINRSSLCGQTRSLKGSAHTKISGRWQLIGNASELKKDRSRVRNLCERMKLNVISDVVAQIG